VDRHVGRSDDELQDELPLETRDGSDFRLDDVLVVTEHRDETHRIVTHCSLQGSSAGSGFSLTGINLHHENRYVRNLQDRVPCRTGVQATRFAACPPVGRWKRDMCESWVGDEGNVIVVRHEKSPGAEAPGRFPVSSSWPSGIGHLPGRSRSGTGLRGRWPFPASTGS